MIIPGGGGEGGWLVVGSGEGEMMTDTSGWLTTSVFPVRGAEGGADIGEDSNAFSELKNFDIL